MSRIEPSPTKISLRNYTPEDFETIYAIDHLSFEPATAYSRRQLRDYLELDGGECIVAEAGGEIAGFIVTAHERGVGYVVTIDVLPGHRQQSVGTKLLAEAEGRLAANEIRTIELETATDNVSAIAFWRKHGYRNRGIIKGYYPNGRDAFSMRKLLA